MSAEPTGSERKSRLVRPFEPVIPVNRPKTALNEVKGLVRNLLKLEARFLVNSEIGFKK